jgi:hypothetical protein
MRNVQHDFRVVIAGFDVHCQGLSALVGCHWI